MSLSFSCLAVHMCVYVRASLRDLMPLMGRHAFGLFYSNHAFFVLMNTTSFLEAYHVNHLPSLPHPGVAELYARAHLTLVVLTVTFHCAFAYLMLQKSYRIMRFDPSDTVEQVIQKVSGKASC